MDEAAETKSWTRFFRRKGDWAETYLLKLAKAGVVLALMLSSVHLLATPPFHEPGPACGSCTQAAQTQTR